MLINLEINKFNIKAAIVDTEESRKKGLSGMSKLGDNKGMLFVFDKPKKVWMIMNGMNFDLDFIFLDENYKVLQLNSLNKDNKEGVESFKPVKMVLEVNKGFIKSSGIKVGTEIVVKKELISKHKSGGSFQKVGDVSYKVKEDDIKTEHHKLQVLNTEGEVTANIEPNARIFSREHTKEIINKVKKAKDQEVGELLVKILDIHDSQKQDYVKTDGK